MSQITLGSMFILGIMLFMTSCGVAQKKAIFKPLVYKRRAIYDSDIKRLLAMTEKLGNNVEVKSYEL